MSIKDITSKGSGSSKTYAGSQLQIQTYVNSCSDEIDAAIQREFPELVGAAFQWRSPLAHEQYREYWDRAFLAVVDQERHWPALKQFWPRGGPHWDALAVVVRDGRAPGVLLVEAKSYVDELLKGAAIGKTVARASRHQIELAMAWTQGTVGMCGRTAAAWCDTPLYQSANRLAHLQWFNCRGVDAWLVHVLFTGDAYTKPATADEWKLAVREADRQLGLEGKPVQRAGYVTLPAVSGQQRVHDGGAPLRSSDVGGFGTTSRLGRAGQRRRDAGPAAPRRVELSDRIRGCLLGGAVGDALGAPVEFDSTRPDPQAVRRPTA